MGVNFRYVNIIFIKKIWQVYIWLLHFNFIISYQSPIPTLPPLLNLQVFVYLRFAKIRNKALWVFNLLLQWFLIETKQNNYSSANKWLPDEIYRALKAMDLFQRSVINTTEQISFNWIMKQLSFSLLSLTTILYFIFLNVESN